MYDVAVIGGGITGTAAAELLSHYEVHVCLIEKEPDIAEGTTKANSGIVHAGYDARPGTKMAELNVRGSKKMEALCRRLSVGYRNTGSLVVSLSPADDAVLSELLERGKRNGVENLRILTGSEACSMEPNLSPDVRCALYAPDAGIVDPFGLAAALAESAALNGCHFYLGSPVAEIQEKDGHFEISAGVHRICARYVVNCAGVHADDVQRMAGEDEFTIRPVRGEYYMLDTSAGNHVRTVVFQCPGPQGKGVLVAPTVHGNLLVGPNAEEVADGDDTATTAEGQDCIRKLAARAVRNIDYRQTIRNFAGVRAYASTGDFIVEASRTVPRLIHAAGICSPGLSASPAIAEECVRLLKKEGLRLASKPSVALRSPPVRIKELSREKRDAWIRRDARYGHVICRCQMITEGEIVDALHREPVSGTVDSLKKRLTTGMGRCQGGFCLPRILKIISRELGSAPEDILLHRARSHVLRSPDAVRSESDDAKQL